MKKKLISLFIIICLVTIILPICNGKIETFKKDTFIENKHQFCQISSFIKNTSIRNLINPDKNTSFYNEQLIYGNKKVGQSFESDYSLITDFKIKIKKIGNPKSGITFSVYDSLSKNKLTSITKPASTIPTNFNWISFNIDDLKVYKNGALWTKMLWGNSDRYDYCFQTFNENGVDQEWTNPGFGTILFHEDIYLAQSFKPSSNKLTKISILTSFTGNPSDLIISILDELDGKELSKNIISADKIPARGGWLEIDIDDINVVIGKKYYIVCREMYTTSNGYYSWFFSYNDNGQNPYSQGEPWESFYGGKYYIVCHTIGGDKNNCYSWQVESNYNPYHKGDCYLSNDSGNSWSEVFNSDLSFKINGKNGENLDQFQHQGCSFGREVKQKNCIAQSFKPSKTHLTKVRLLLFSNFHTTGNIIVSIRNNLRGNDLATAKINYNDFFSMTNGAPFWYEFDFSDIRVIPGKTYYIVCKAPETNQAYWWVCKSSDYYPKGKVYASTDNDKTWSQSNFFAGEDLCFETYYSKSSNACSRQKPLIDFFSNFKLIKNLFNSNILNKFIQFL